MSERGLYTLSDGSFCRTQGEIPKGEPTCKVMVPIDSHGLCAFLNNFRAGIIAQMQPDPNSLAPSSPMVEAASAVETPSPSPAPPPVPQASQVRSMDIEALEERILELKGPAFGRIMAASVERLGGLGRDGWQALRSHLDLFVKPSNYDKGLNILSLGQIERLNEEKPKPRSYAELNG